MEMISAILRPKASATRPPMKAPKNRPSGLIDSTAPSCLALRWNSGPSLGAAIPIDCRSMPSMKVAQKQSARVIHAPAPTPPLFVSATLAMSPPQGP